MANLYTSPSAGETGLEAPVVVNLLPGPVTPHPDVWRAFCAPPVSHRAASFLETFRETKELLCQLVGAERVGLFLGSGTLANEVVASYLETLPGRGVILVNGEFGERLVDHARRLNLAFTELESKWGEPLQYERLEQMADELDWIWFVHCETSTGLLNDLPRLAALAREHEIRLCVDAISSIGVVPVNLGEVFLASGVASKGLGSLPGLAIVFYNQKPLAVQRKPPRYFDLDYYDSKEGVPFTTSSNLLFALHAALVRLDPATRFSQLETLSAWLHHKIKRRGLEVLVPHRDCSPAVITVVLPKTVSSLAVGEELDRCGYWLSYRSQYLLERNLIQICLMSEHTLWTLERVPELLYQSVSKLHSGRTVRHEEDTSQKLA